MLFGFLLMLFVQSTYSSEYVDPSNAVGTPCSQDLASAWLDIVVLVDVSARMAVQELDLVGQSMSSLFSQMSVGQGHGTANRTHTSRIALITYSAEGTERWDLDQADERAGQGFLALANYSSSDQRDNLAVALETAESMLKHQRSFRFPVFLLISPAIAADNDTNRLVHRLKADGVTIMTLDASTRLQTTTDDGLAALSSHGYSYSLKDSYLVPKLAHGLSQINCKCPPGYHQLRFRNLVTFAQLLYADCFQGVPESADPALAPKGCTPGVLASVKSAETLDFLIDNVLNSDLVNRTEFTVGAVRIEDRWYWERYDHVPVEFGEFPVVKRGSGSLGYFRHARGFNWEFVGGEGGPDNARPYICQTRACDVSHFF